MGAAAGKQFQSDKAKHASAVLSAVEAYEKSHPGEFDRDDYQHDPGLFRRRVLIAAAEAKRSGKDIDRSLSQLTDADLETLCTVVEKLRRERMEELQREQAASIPIPFEMEDAVSSEEDQQAGNDQVDETTSVLSYGDGEAVMTARDSDHELEFAEESAEAKGRGEEKEPCSDDEAPTIYPMRLTQDALRRLTPGGRASGASGIAEALSKLWEIEDLTFDSPVSSAKSHGRPRAGSAEDKSLKKSTQDRLRHGDLQNETLMGLQRQKVMSITQNAQLEREVEALQRQLEKMDALEQSLSASSPPKRPAGRPQQHQQHSEAKHSPSAAECIHSHSSSHAPAAGGAAAIFPEPHRSQHVRIFPIREDTEQLTSPLAAHPARRAAFPRRGGGLQSDQETASEDEGAPPRSLRKQRDGALKNLNKRRYSLDGAVNSVESLSAALDAQALSREDYKSPKKPVGRGLRARLRKESSQSSQESLSMLEPGPGVDTGTPSPIPRHAAKGKKKTRAAAAEPPKEAAPAGQDAEAAAESPWSLDLDYSWAEVSLLLRKPIRSEEDMLYTVAAAEAGILFTDQMNELAKSLQVLRGTLSRWLLPFDNNTRIESQCSTPQSVLQAMPAEFRGKLSERQVHYLVAGANGVRRLVRIKIADDNDLEQARRALQTTNSFFQRLYARASRWNQTPFGLLQASGAL